MKSLLVMVLFLLPVTYALDIGLSIENLFSVDVLYFSYNDTGVRSFTTELLNSGSLPYYAQVRVDVFDQNRTMFTGWSDRKRMMPGNNGFFRLYWIPESGSYMARLRIYYGNEIEERWVNITATNMTGESVFDVTYTRLLDRYIELSIDGPAREKIAVIPADYPQGWVFVQRAGMPGRFLMPYNAPGLDNREITIYIASENSFTKKSVVLRSEQSMDAMLRNLAIGALSTI